MRTLLILVLIILMLFAFTPKEKSIVGLYGECPDGYMACTQLNLKSDSTFEYFVFFDVGGGTIKEGTWKVDGDTLILNTYNQPHFRILDSTYNDTKEISFFVSDSIPLFSGTVIINHSDTLALDYNGKSKYTGDIKKVQISGLMIQPIDFTVNLKSYSKIEFHVNIYVCYNPDCLTNEKLIIDGNRIKRFLHCHDKFDDIGLKKTNIRNKAF